MLFDFLFPSQVVVVTPTYVAQHLRLSIRRLTVTVSFFRTFFIEYIITGIGRIVSSCSLEGQPFDDLPTDGEVTRPHFRTFFVGNGFCLFHRVYLCQTFTAIFQHFGVDCSFQQLFIGQSQATGRTGTQNLCKHIKTSVVGRCAYTFTSCLYVIDGCIE